MYCSMAMCVCGCGCGCGNDWGGRPPEAENVEEMVTACDATGNVVVDDAVHEVLSRCDVRGDETDADDGGGRRCSNGGNRGDPSRCVVVSVVMARAEDDVAAADDDNSDGEVRDKPIIPRDVAVVFPLLLPLPLLL